MREWARENLTLPHITKAFAVVITALVASFVSFKNFENKIEEEAVKRELARDIEFQKQKDLIRELQTNLFLMEAGSSKLPLARWIKSLPTDNQPGRYVYINEIAEEMFFTPHGWSANSIFGKDDIEIWGAEIAAPYIKDDLYVARTGKVLNTFTPIAFPINYDINDIRVIKYPRVVGNKVIGVEGMAIPRYKPDFK